MYNAQIESVVNNLGEIIGQELRAFSSQYWQPAYGPDQSESEMNFRKERIKRLRAVREEFENLMCGLEKETV